jgi:hypothetical protein
MFKVHNHKPLITDLPVITDNYLVLLSDENPVLYTGTNRYGNRVLGVIVEESEEDFSVRYFHVIVDDYTYYLFIEKKTTLRKILEAASYVFVLDFKNDEIINNNMISVQEIPEDYLPHEDSFCPDIILAPTLDYGISLKGKKAELHLVDVDELTSVQTSFVGVLEKAMESLHKLELKPKCYSAPAKAGSYQVNYRIEFENNQMPLFGAVDGQHISDFLQAYLNYLIAKLPNEEKNALKEKDIVSPAFKNVEEKLSKIYKEGLITTPKEVIEQQLIHSFNETALLLQEVTAQIQNSSSFTRIEMLNYDTGGGQVGLGVMDATYFDSVKDKIYLEPPETLKDLIEVDKTPQNYRLMVYFLNSERGIVNDM